MKRALAGLGLFLLAAAAPAAERGGGPQGSFRTDVPAEAFTLLAGRPTDSSVVLSLLAAADLEGRLLYGEEGGPRTNRTETVRFPAGEPRLVPLCGLRPDTRYRYALLLRESTGEYREAAEGTFHTQRRPGSAFSFTVTADSHLDVNTDPALYARTLRDAARDRPDFHVDLGDTFMTDKRKDRTEDARPQYLAQRHYFGILCASAPLFLASGNHDGETGRSAAAAERMRKSLFPSPEPDAFYTGGSDANYFAWTWGDALFVVLDPFRHSPRPQRGAENDAWHFTLGREQYDWFRRTLEGSSSKFKFVFIHNLAGGLDRQGRGGAEAAGFFEWGGRDLDGSETFARHRPGWPMPIHALLVRHGVTAVFHGHDHFYARQEADGIVYQLVPQPGHPGAGSVRSAEEYGYTTGDRRPGSGYLRVTVTGDSVTVAFLRPGVPEPAAAYTLAAPSP